MFWKFMPLIKTSFFSLQIHFYIPFSFVGQIQNLFEKFIESYNLGRIQKMIWMESNRFVMSIVRCCCSVFVIVVMFWVQREEKEEGGENWKKRQKRSNYYFLGLLMLILFRRHESPLLLASIRESFRRRFDGG